MNRCIQGRGSGLLRFFPNLWLTLLISGAILLFSGGCSEKEAKKPTPAAPIKMASAVLMDIPVEIPANGTVEAFSTVNITSRVEGNIVQVHVEEGQNIEKGQLLFSIDDRAYQASFESARSNLLKDQVRLEKAKKDAQRYADLFEKDYVTKTQYEQAVADAEALKETVKGDEALLENANLNLGYCKITAPVGGRAGEILIQEGNTVKPNDSRPLMIIHQVAPIYIKFSVPEQYLPEIQNKMSATELVVQAILPGDQKETKKGKLTFVDNAINDKTGTIGLKAVFENDDNRLWPGEFINVLLLLGTRPKVVVVPSEGVQIGQQGNFVFVVKKDQTVELRPVTAGIVNNGHTVIEKGLDPGEMVVTDGHLRLFDGAKVTIQNETKPGGEPRK
jgi:membrane fusion protein, multidrug efflux system